MPHTNQYDVIIAGGSYAGMAAALALGRALRKVLIIDSGMPCNRQTPRSHNFLTNDGKSPAEIARAAKQQVEQYDTITFLSDIVTNAHKSEAGFSVHTIAGKIFNGRKIIIATGIRDIMPPINGYTECWGISVLHCPYCHGYEVRNETTGILGNGESAFEFAALISHWTNDLTLFTNGPCTFTPEQKIKLRQHNINIIETEIEKLDHITGQLQKILFKDGHTFSLKALYARSPFEQSSDLPQKLKCLLTDDGYIQTDAMQKTNTPGVFACGDNTTRMRTVANAVAMGTTTGMMVNRELRSEEF